jgi:UDP-glucuronate 4-epimerase
MSVLVTGAAGFIGAAVAERLLARGETVLGIDSLNDYYPVELKRARLARVAAAGGERFRFQQLDFSNFGALQAALADARFERIVHLGAQPGVRYSIENPHAYVQANVVGHLNLLELARHRGVAHLVYASSSSVYGGNIKVPFSVEDRVDHPLSLYAATKKADELMSETYAHLYRLPQTGLRFFTVYGPWGRPDMMVWLFTQKLLSGEALPVYNNGNSWRDFTFIDDVVSGVVACLDRPPTDDGRAKPGGSTAPHAVYNLGNNRSENVLDVIRLIEGACGRAAELEMLPPQPGDAERTFADIDAAVADVGFAPVTPIAQGVPLFVDWYRKHYGV